MHFAIVLAAFVVGASLLRATIGIMAILGVAGISPNSTSEDIRQ